MNTWSLTIDAENIGWLTLDVTGQRVNTLSSEVMLALGDMVDQLEQTQLTGLVLQSGKAGGFVAGADIVEFDSFDDAPALTQALKQAHGWFDRLEALPYPTVCAINGFCLGGGLELALAFDYRIAVSGAKLGFPEVKLGLFPGFGGTGRSIQLSGPIAGMTAMLTGRQYSASAAKKIGWVDRVVESPDRLRWVARRLIQRPPKRSAPGLAHRLWLSTPGRYLLADRLSKQTRKKVNPEHYPAPFALIDLFKSDGASSRSMRAAEIGAFPALMISEQSRSLRRLFLTSEQLKKHTSPFVGQRVHVIGAGVMGGDIAAWAALCGYEVTLQDLSMDAIKPAVKRAQALFAKRLSNPVQRRNAQARLTADAEGQGLARADVVIEAVVERLDVKQSLWASIEPKTKAGAMLASNTSSLDIAEIAADLQQPERLVGLHFFNPVAQLPLVEIIHAPETDPAAVEQAKAFAVALRKTPLAVKSSPGFLVNRVLAPYMFGAAQCLENGHSMLEIDAAAVAFGMPMGPIELMDRVGLDVCLAVAAELGLQSQESDPIQRWVAQGHLGQKTGQGFYTWPLKRTLPAGDPALGRKLLDPLYQACVQCLDEGIVESAEALDTGVVFGTGFAPFLGGPLRANTLGAL